MSKIIQSLWDYQESKGTYEGYYAQFKHTPKEIHAGETYVIHPNTWQQETVEILYVDNKVALGKVTEGFQPGYRYLYHNDGDRVGWKYCDGRPSYRLQLKETQDNDNT